MDLGKLETLAQELFVDNFKLVKGKYVSPLNVDSMAEEVGASERRKKERERELYNLLVPVAEAIERSGGISEAIYETHKYAINSLVRDLTRQRWWGSALNYLCEKEDREGKKATPEQIARFNNGKYGAIVDGSHVNIFDEGYEKSGFEGTLFQTDYDKDRNLATFRIFHQGHRDALQVKTANVPELVDKIKSYVAGFSDNIPETQFTLDRDTYLQKMEEFNAKFGDYVRVEIVGKSNRAAVVARFNENPERLASRFVELGQANGMEVKARKGQMTYMISRGASDYDLIDLFLPSHLELSWEHQPFDPEKHRDAPTMILPYLAPELSIPLLKMYLSAQEK